MEVDLRRGRRDLRIMAKTRGQPLRQDLPVQCDKSQRVHERRGEQATIPRNWALRVQVDGIIILLNPVYTDTRICKSLFCSSSYEQFMNRDPFNTSRHVSSCYRYR